MTIAELVADLVMMRDNLTSPENDAKWRIGVMLTNDLLDAYQWREGGCMIVFVDGSAIDSQTRETSTGCVIK